MSQFWDVVRHEFRMSIGRKGMWIAYGLVYAFYGMSVLPVVTTVSSEFVLPPVHYLWSYAAEMMFMFNMFMPLVGGILAADRMQRDFRLGVRELQNSTPLRIPAYILAKYVGVLASVLTPMLLWVLAMGFLLVGFGRAPFSFLGILLLAFLGMGVPAYAFVVAFSLACPLIMPLRVYQVLFTGYWFWGNYLNPAAFPTLAGTLLTPNGRYVMDGFFGGFPSGGEESLALYTAPDAILNLLVLGLCIFAALFVLDRYLRWQARRA
jgi:ABC-type Na+ efflux pump permease subunit